MSKVYNSYNLFRVCLTLIFPLLFFVSLAQFTYAQCNVLCSQHREGDLTSITDNFLSAPYQVALQDGNDTDMEVAEESPSTAAAEDTIDTTFIEDPSKKWQFTITPYGWFMGLNGDLGVGRQTVDLDVSFFDILQNLDIAAELHAEAWKDKYGFFIDGTFSKITLKGDAQLKLDRSIKIKSTTKFFLGEFGAFYRVGTWPMSKFSGAAPVTTKKSVTFDIIGGGRYWWMKNKVDVTGPRDIVNPEFSASKDWFDFIVGGRVIFDIDKFFVAIRSDVGGFGLGFSSDISWNIAGYFGYELPWYNITPVIGFRALYDKYDSGSGDNRFLWDAWMYGPQLGIAFKF